jgi:hypothetical protein
LAFNISFLLPKPQLNSFAVDSGSGEDSAYDSGEFRDFSNMKSLMVGI